MFPDTVLVQGDGFDSSFLVFLVFKNLNINENKQPDGLIT
jgi:hypothetical protein